MAKRQHKPVCMRHERHEANFLIRNIRFKNQPVSAIIFAFEDISYAHLPLIH
jgi:hypothetical protein